MDRPRKEITLPPSPFTFKELAQANDHVTELTLRKFLKCSMENEKPLFTVKKIGPKQKKGLGRMRYLYSRTN